VESRTVEQQIQPVIWTVAILSGVHLTKTVLPLACFVLPTAVERAVQRAVAELSLTSG
jgi:hypothetical protein